MQLRKSTICYSIVYGLVPYFQHMLTDLIKKLDKVVVIFDESMNKISRKNQMDIFLKFWDDKKLVTTRYFGSVFLKRGTADNIFEGLKTSLGSGNVKKTI